MFQYNSCGVEIESDLLPAALELLFASVQAKLQRMANKVGLFHTHRVVFRMIESKVTAGKNRQRLESQTECLS